MRALPDEQLLKECAAWIYSKKHDGFWTPYVLTALNKRDHTNPHISFDDAFWVFSELAKHRLMVHKIYETPNGDFPAFGFNFAKEKEWKSLAEKRGVWKLKIWPFIKWLAKKSWLVIIFAVTVVLTNILAEVTKRKVNGYLDSAQAAPPISQSSPPRLSK